jgi:DNA-binding IclR family transcriptional regulator
MWSTSPIRPVPLSAEAGSVLAALVTAGGPQGLRLNDLSERTGLPTGHVGRHLRTLERDRLARYGAGTWRATARGEDHPAVQKLAA